MNSYEIVFIVHPDLDQASFDEVTEKVKSWITDSEGTIEKVDVWGKRRMAYEIRKQREGQYVLIEAKAKASAIIEFERNFRILEPVMRFLITRMDSK